MLFGSSSGYGANPRREGNRNDPEGAVALDLQPREARRSPLWGGGTSPLALPPKCYRPPPTSFALSRSTSPLVAASISKKARILSTWPGENSSRFFSTTEGGGR